MFQCAVLKIRLTEIISVLISVHDLETFVWKMFFPINFVQYSTYNSNDCMTNCENSKWK